MGSGAAADAVMMQGVRYESDTDAAAELRDRALVMLAESRPKAAATYTSDDVRGRPCECVGCSEVSPCVRNEAATMSTASLSPQTQVSPPAQLTVPQQRWPNCRCRLSPLHRGLLTPHPRHSFLRASNISRIARVVATQVASALINPTLRLHGPLKSGTSGESTSASTMIRTH